MKVLVCPHTMELGGSQLNAVQLARAVRDAGHEVVLYSDPGELVSMAEGWGLEVVIRRRSPLCPSPERVLELRRLVSSRGFDVLHGYEWPPILECEAAAWPNSRAVTVGTVLSMGVAGFLPGSTPLVVGTERLRRIVSRTRSGPVRLMEPPVDTEANEPGPYAADFRATLPPGEGQLVVIVSRLARELKLEGILTAVAAVGELARTRDVRLLVIGDGPVRKEIEEAAAGVNAARGRDVALVMGQLDDPRGAYDAADVCIGMGGSALRALAFGTPLVVQGEGGFFEVLDRESAPTFLEQGWYGVADRGPAAATTHLVGLLAQLLDAPEAAASTSGDFGRSLVLERFSLASAAESLERLYEQAVEQRRPALRLGEAWTSGVRLTAHKATTRWESLRGRGRRDDFNAQPL
jgi:hypothetical protein